tara:strand:- start:15519 stop:16574 length:1056 start_codon:yes stop_codon:yes gene_type:complete
VIRNEDFTDAVALVQRHLKTATTGWSIGSFGVIAEFHRDADEAAEVLVSSGGGAVVTGKGAIRIDLKGDATVFPYETPSRNRARWNQGVNICLPDDGAGRMAGRVGLTEIGPDGDAVREEDRDAVLFDLGLGLPHVDACVRTGDPDLIEALRAHAGADMLSFEGPAMTAVIATSPHRVFLSRLGRVEVYQYIPSQANGLPTPHGPHTHLLPRLAAHQRTHAANVPLPEGRLPCLSMYPANPLSDGLGNARPFDPGAHDAFQDIVQRFAHAGHLRLKRRVTEAVRQGQMIDMPDMDRMHRALVRVCLRQIRCTNGETDTLACWRQMYEPGPADAQNPDGDHDRENGDASERS